jgi:hypothetical protein
MCLLFLVFPTNFSLLYLGTGFLQNLMHRNKRGAFLEEDVCFLRFPVKRAQKHDSSLTRIDVGSRNKLKNVQRLRETHFDCLELEATKSIFLHFHVE